MTTLSMDAGMTGRTCSLTSNVDDLVITGADHDEITRSKEEMKKEVLMSDLGLLSST